MSAAIMKPTGYTGLIGAEEDQRQHGILRPVGRVLLGYPVGASEMTAFSASVRRLITYEGLKPPAERAFAGTTVAPGLYVDDNRNELAKRALDYPNVEWLWQVDTDIEFKPDVLDRMLALAEPQGIKVLAASVPIGETWPTAAYMLSKRPGEWDPVAEVPQAPVLVDGIATACTLIHRDVLEAIAVKYGRRWFNRIEIRSSPQGTPSHEVEYLTAGEDFSFCLRARECGFPIYCAHVPGLRHWKLKGYTHDGEDEWPRLPRRGE